MRDVRIVFMGTPDFAVTILAALLEHSYPVVGVVTVADKPAGRGRKLTESAVKQFATAQGLPILQPTNLNSDEFIENLRAWNANLFVVVAFRMLPKKVWQLPSYGTFNLHASLLPAYRGAAPIHWAIIKGEKTTGVTTFFIDDAIDTGDIILQKETDIGDDETVGSLHDRLMYLGATAVIETVDLIARDDITTKTQSQKYSLAPKLNPENCRVNWSASLDEIYNLIRGLNPFPAAWTCIQNGQEEIQAKLYEVVKQQETHTYPIGQIISTKKTLHIAVEGGFIEILSIKVSGKRKMKVSELLNGYTFEEAARMV